MITTRAPDGANKKATTWGWDKRMPKAKPRTQRQHTKTGHHSLIEPEHYKI